MRIIQFSEKTLDSMLESTRKELNLSTMIIKEKHPDSKAAVEELHRLFNYYIVCLINNLKAS